MPQFESAARYSRFAQGQDRASGRYRCRQRRGGDRGRRLQGDRRGVKIRAAQQYRRDHQLRHGADAARYRGSQADGARRRRKTGATAVWMMVVRTVITLAVATLVIAIGSPAQADPREVLRVCQAVIKRADQSVRDASVAKPD